MTKICQKCQIKYDDSFNRCDICNKELVTLVPEEKKDEKEELNEESVKTEIIDSIKEDIYQKFSNDYLIFDTVTVIKKSSYETIEKKHIKNKHGAGTKVLATIVGGPLGFVATTGIKEETSTEKVKKDGEYLHIKTKINKKHFIYQTYVDNTLADCYKDSKICDKSVINWRDIDSIDDDYYLILKTGETLKCPVFQDKILINIHISKIINNRMPIRDFNEKYYGSIDKIIKEYYLELINEYAKNSIDENVNGSNNDALNELERLANLYEKGLLTDEEFANMKKKIIND